MKKEEIVADMQTKLIGCINTNTFISIEDHASDNKNIACYQTTFGEVNPILKQLNRSAYTLVSRDVNHLETCDFNYIWLKVAK
jgi:hypothetical protein